MRDREHFRKAYLKELVACGLIELTMPDKPRSSKQHYRLTRAGADFLKSIEEKS
jgi:ATP-dependent DNA helicase RecG